MTIAKKQILSLVLLFLLVIALPLVIIFSRIRQDIRPRALQGKADLLLSSSNNSPQKGEEFDVLISMQLTDAALRVSGADVTVLYDKNKLTVDNVVPFVTSVDSKAAFTDAIHVSKGGNFDDKYNFVRVAVVSTKNDSKLKGGTISVAKITFKASSEGEATIKLPDDNKFLEVVGINIIPVETSPAVTAVITAIPSDTPASPSATGVSEEKI